MRPQSIGKVPTIEPCKFNEALSNVVISLSGAFGIGTAGW